MISSIATSGNISLKRVIIKGLLLFLLIDLFFVPLDPIPHLGQISGFNLLFPGRLRLPYGEKSDLAYNLSLYSLEAMFASHELAMGNKPVNEYRVVLIGDSSVWGYLLKPENTLAGDINTANWQWSDSPRLQSGISNLVAYQGSADFKLCNEIQSRYDHLVGDT
jgi:hypothetical protein